MEEDLKILKDLQWQCKHFKFYRDDTGEIKAQAIENILTRLEQDERVIDKIKEYAHQEVVSS